MLANRSIYLHNSIFSALYLFIYTKIDRSSALEQ